MSYSYKAYDPYEDEKYKKAKNALDAHGTYQPGDNYTKAMDYASKIENREQFSYDINADALYQQFKDNYIQQGQMARMDTMGQAAAMTGGYGNSYAQSAGQQAYNQQLNQLNNIVPELYGMAYSRYQQEGKDLQDAFNMYMGLEDRNKEHWDKEYNRLSAEEQNLYKRGYDAWDKKNTQAWNEYAASLKANNPEDKYLKLEAGSEAYQYINKRISAAESLADLKAIAEEYTAMGYDPDVIDKMMASKYLKLKSTGNTAAEDPRAYIKDGRYASNVFMP